MSNTYKPKVPVYAVVRVDGFLNPETDLQARITIKEIVRERETAECEVERLNRLAADRSCVYFWQATRLYPPGTQAGPGPQTTSNPSAPEPAVTLAHVVDRGGGLVEFSLEVDGEVSSFVAHGVGLTEKDSGLRGLGDIEPKEFVDVPLTAQQLRHLVRILCEVEAGVVPTLPLRLNRR